MYEIYDSVLNVLKNTVAFFPAFYGIWSVGRAVSTHQTLFDALKDKNTFIPSISTALGGAIYNEVARIL